MNVPTQQLTDPVTTPRRPIEGAIRSTQQAAHQAVDQLAGGAEHLAANAERVAQRGADALREHSELLRERARPVIDGTMARIHQEPLKSVLVAGAIGAVLGVLFTLLGRGRA